MTQRDTGVVSSWIIEAPPRTLIPSPIDSARRVTLFPVVSALQQTPTPPNMWNVTERDIERVDAGRQGRTYGRVKFPLNPQ